MTIRRLLNKCLILSLVGVLSLLTSRAALAHAPSAGLETTPGSRSTSVEGPSAYVVAWRLNVRSGPGTGYQILTTVSCRERLSLTGRTAAGSWLLIRTGEREQGWVSAHYMVVSGAHLSAVPILDGTQCRPPPRSPPTSPPIASMCAADPASAIL